MLCLWYPGFVSLCDFSFLSVSFALFHLVSFLFLGNSKTYTHCHPSSLSVVCSDSSRSCLCSRVVWKWMLWKSDSEHRPRIAFTASSFPTCLYPSWSNSCHSSYFICSVLFCLFPDSPSSMVSSWGRELLYNLSM